MLLDSIGHRPGVLPSILQGPGQPSHNKHLAPDVSGAEVEKPWSKVRVKDECRLVVLVERIIGIQGRDLFQGKSGLWWRMVQKLWLS